MDNLFNLKENCMYNNEYDVLLTFKKIYLYFLKDKCLKPQIENIPHSDIFKRNIITNIFCPP